MNRKQLTIEAELTLEELRFKGMYFFNMLFSKRQLFLYFFL